MSIRSFRRAHARRIERERRRLTTAKRRSVLVAGATLSASALMVSSAAAADYTVTTSGDGAGSCTGSAPAFSCDTLRAAVSAANGSGDATNTISFDMSSVTSPITVGSPLVITGDHALTINGPGAGSLAIDGANATKIFVDNAPNDGDASVEIDNLTVQHGKSTDPGGAILTSGPSNTGAAPLTLDSDTITGNTTTVSSDKYGGGGIFAEGPLTVKNSTISGNTAPNGFGGGIGVAEADNNSGSGPFGTKYDLTVENSTISGNSAIGGGGIDGSNNLIVTGSTITGNTAQDTGGRGGYGGGIYRSSYPGFTTSTVANTTITNNTASRGGGGMQVSAKYGTSVADSTISGNTAAFGGGLEIWGQTGEAGYDGKYNPTTITHTTISGNQGSGGAGINVEETQPGNAVTIRDSTLSGNQGGTGSFGGGLLVDRYVVSPVQVQNSTISGNSATHGGGVSVGYGGSTRPVLYKGRTRSGSVDLTNSTVAANTATATDGGGGVYLGAYHTGGTGAVAQSAKVGLTSTIVSGNNASGSANDLGRGTGSTSGGFLEAFSLIQAPGSAPVLGKRAVITGADPKLGALGIHGGSVQTMVPAGTSPVIDQGQAPASLSQDARGSARTVDVPGIPNAPSGGDGTDIGAVELPASAVVVPPVNLTATVRGKLLGGSKTPLVNGSSTPVSCAVNLGTLSSCIVEVRNGKGKLLANGAATARSRSSLTAIVGLTDAGRAALAHSPGGLSGTATVSSTTSRGGSKTVSGKVNVLGGSPITIGLGSRSAKLSTSVLSQLDNLAKTLSSGKSITCTAYSDKGKGDVSLTKAQAKAACNRLVKDGFKGTVKSFGAGHSHLIGPSHSTKNRRLVISYKL